MQTVNFISGLGADERVFQYLKIPNFEKNYIHWIDPLKNENIEQYSKRLIEQIDLSKRNILVCVSFGGLIGIEISKLFEIEKIIIISSVKNKFEIPFFYRLLGKLKINHLIPTRLFKTNKKLLQYFFGIKNRSEKELLNEIIESTDVAFLKWAVHIILNWNNTEKVKNIYHLHGTKDRLFPNRNIADFIEIKNGHHFMIVSKSENISTKINEILNG